MKHHDLLPGIMDDWVERFDNCDGYSTAVAAW